MEHNQIEKSNTTYESFDSCEKNPFMGYDNKIVTKQKIKYGKASEQVIVNEATGELESTYHKMGTTETVSEEKFVQIYVKGLKDIFSLGLSAQCVVSYIIEYCIKPNDDRIYFSKHDCKEKLGYKSKNMVYRGLLELLQKSIIAKVKGDGNLFFINPHYIFNGKRVAFFQAYEKAGDDFDKSRFDNAAKKLNP